MFPTPLPDTEGLGEDEAFFAIGRVIEEWADWRIGQGDGPKRIVRYGDRWTLRQLVRTAWLDHYSGVASGSVPLGSKVYPSAHTAGVVGLKRLWLDWRKHTNQSVVEPERQAESWEGLLRDWGDARIERDVENAFAYLEAERKTAERAFSPPADEGAEPESSPPADAVGGSSPEAEAGSENREAPEQAKAKGPRWKAVGGQLIGMAESGENYTSTAKLADRFECSRRTISQAISGDQKNGISPSPYLKNWAGHKDAGDATRAQHRNDVAREHKARNRQDPTQAVDADDYAANANLDEDATLRRLVKDMKKAGYDQKAIDDAKGWLGDLPVNERREAAAAYQSNTQGL